MPIQPDWRSMHVSQPLSNISTAFVQTQDRFVADKVFPIVPVSKQADLYYRYKKDDWFRTIADERAPATESAGGGWELDTDSYYARVYSVHKDVDDQTRANADSMFNLDRDASLWCTMNMMLRREKIFVANYLATSVWGLDLTGVSGSPSTNQFKQWDASGSTPIEDVTTQRVRISEVTGFEPNTLVLGARVFPALINNAEIIDRIKYTQSGFVSQELLAAALGVDRVLVARASENTAIKGATASLSYMFNKAALLCYSAPNPGLLTPSAGYTFSWTGLTGGGVGAQIRKFRMEAIRSDRIEADMAFDMKVVAPELGTYFGSAVA